MGKATVHTAKITPMTNVDRDRHTTRASLASLQRDVLARAHAAADSGDAAAVLRAAATIDRQDDGTLRPVFWGVCFRVMAHALRGSDPEDAIVVVESVMHTHPHRCHRHW
ncbi:hypothetical protein EDF19_0675 [Curtobacterium sp. PhB115]|nr:hypothetical protein EDF19_0675 [Curtobacterium sp. PhB115]